MYDQDEMSTDASYQVSVHLAKLFQRKRFFKLTNQMPMSTMFVKWIRTKLAIFIEDLPFYPVVSEEKINMKS